MSIAIFGAGILGTCTALELADRVRTVNDAGGFASISSVVNTAAATLGVSAEIKDIYSEPAGILLRNNAIVRGNLKTAGALETQAGARVDGTVTQQANLQPLDVVSWDVAFPGTNRGS